MTKISGRIGAYWIDHVVVPTNKLNAWNEWSAIALGLRPGPLRGISTLERKRGIRTHCFLDIADGDGEDDIPGQRSHHIGVLVATETMAEDAAGLEKATPRTEFFVRPEDIDEHRARLERADQYARKPGSARSELAGALVERGIPYSHPIRTSIGGEEGTVIYFEDPDANQW